MGRHSAPDEAADALLDLDQPVDVLLAEAPVGRGRHAAPDDADEPRAAQVPARARATNADLHMLRVDPALRARCAAAVVVPFLLYTVVLVVIGRTGLFLLWVWIPLVTAGVVAGMFLDLAARSRAEADDSG
jgi:hypothetical protein